MFGIPLMMAGQAPSTLPNGLLAFWNFDNNLNDATGLNPAGTVFVGTLSYTTGKVGQAGYNSGNATCCLKMAQGAKVQPRLALSISAWVRDDGTPNTNCRFLGDWHQVTTLDRWLMFFPAGSPNAPSFVLSNESETQVYNKTFGALGTGWHHLVATWSAADGVKQYKDGVLVNSGTFNVATLNAANSVGITAFQQAESGGPLYGAIDCFGIWNRVLAPSEVTELYNSGAGKAYPF